MMKAACKKTINWGFAYSFRGLLNDHDGEEHDLKQAGRQAERAGKTGPDSGIL